MSNSYDTSIPDSWWESDVTQSPLSGSPLTPTLDFSDTQPLPVSWLVPSQTTMTESNCPTSPNKLNTMAAGDFTYDPYPLFSAPDYFDGCSGDLSGIYPETELGFPELAQNSCSARQSTPIKREPSLEPLSPLGNDTSIIDSKTSAACESGLGKIRSRGSRSIAAGRVAKRSRGSSPSSPSLSPRVSSPEAADDDAAEKCKSRSSHNEIERKYRNRLKDHFELLVEALEGPDREDGSDERQGSRRPSKAEVLIMARRKIRVLERRVEAQAMEMKRLQATLSRFQDPSMLSLPTMSFRGISS